LVYSHHGKLIISEFTLKLSKQSLVVLNADLGKEVAEEVLGLFLVCFKLSSGFDISIDLGELQVVAFTFTCALTLAFALTRAFSTHLSEIVIIIIITAAGVITTIAGGAA